MNTQSRTVVSLLIALACFSLLPARLASQGQIVENASPVFSNLDIPPQEAPDPEETEREQLAELAAQEPDNFHALLVQLDPTRVAKEQLATLAILYPQAFRRAHPKSTEELRAEAAAAHAILNPVFSLPGLADQN